MNTELQTLDGYLRAQLGTVVLGLDDAIGGLLVALLARGHVLVQGPPGLGKTLMSKGLARVLGGTFKRIQGTADLMPADVTGVHVYESASQRFIFREGPLFADVVLVDEINRAGPKTQSAMLEAMEERQVTVERECLPLPPDFLVIATQNPREFEGTYPLPESQLDRFMLRIDVTYPTREVETVIVTRYGGFGAVSEPLAALQPLDRGVLERAREEAAAVHLSESLLGYVLDLAQATREHPQAALGVSPRGVLALVRAARIVAAVRGGEFVTPDDVKAVAVPVLAHRIQLTAEAALEGMTDRQFVVQLLEKTAVPR